jgi:hypothetical protein
MPETGEKMKGGIDRYSAFAVSQAAYNTFERYGDKGYASSKTTIFLRRCGIRALPTDRGANEDTLKQVCFAMLDAEAERVFWKELLE